MITSHPILLRACDVSFLRNRHRHSENLLPFFHECAKSAVVGEKILKDESEGRERVGGIANDDEFSDCHDNDNDWQQQKKKERLLLCPSSSSLPNLHIIDRALVLLFSSFSPDLPTPLLLFAITNF